MDILSLIAIVALIGLDIVGVYFILRLGVDHSGLLEPETPEESPAVQRLRQLNAERLERIEAARAHAALPAGESKAES
ncbi:MAG: hypothetical protein AELANPGJ_02364 [Anaerolineae bacterium]|nr:hypothetical protein [Anaerolineae bacterium]